MKKNKIAKEKTVQISVLGNNIYMNNEITNFKSVKKTYNTKNNVKNNNLLFQNENDLIDFINKNYNQKKKIDIFQIENKNNELEKINRQLNEEINRNKENEKIIKKLKNDLNEKNEEISKNPR